MDEVRNVIRTSRLSERQAKERIVSFVQRFGNLHMDLACHAAFPLVLTPDLLYRIWASFLPQIPWTAVSDILLSPLCREISHETYEMELSIRTILLNELRENRRFGAPRLSELSGFLQEYILANSNEDDPDEQDIAEAQVWTALSHTEPERVARDIASKIADPSRVGDSELLRIAGLTEAISGQLQEYSPLVDYALGMERLVHGDQGRASQLLDRVFGTDKDIEISGVTLLRPILEPEVVQVQGGEAQSVDIPSAVPPAFRTTGKTRIFISYRRADSKYVTDRISDRLVGTFGEQAVFRDIESIPIGVDFKTVLETEIRDCTVMLVVIGPQWATVEDQGGNKRLFEPSDYTRLEVETGLKHSEILVVPVLVLNARMPAAGELPESLTELTYRNAIIIRNDPDFDHDFERLAQVIERNPRVSEKPEIRTESPVRTGGESRIFISYRRADSGTMVKNIREKLMAAFGEQSLFRDVESIPIGADVPGILEGQIGQCNVMLVIIGPQWADITDEVGQRRILDPDDFVRFEIEAALSRAEILVIPILVMGAEMPPSQSLPESLSQLARLNALRLRNDPDFDLDLDLEPLIQLIEKHPRRREKSAEFFEPETILVEAGPFLMGSPPMQDVPQYETPQHQVLLPAYRIGKYPITNAQYEQFARETGTLISPNMGWSGQRSPEGMENYPVVGVTWYEALAYCQWLSQKTGRNYTLPNEAQWEKACRGSTRNIYPWGNGFDPTRCNQGKSQPASVDTYPPQSELGCFDLVGNVRQWTCSLWGQEGRAAPRYAYPWSDDDRNDLNANPQIRRVVRGSSFQDDPNNSRCSFRSGQLPNDAGVRGSRCGFRVVMTLAAQPGVFEPSRDVPPPGDVSVDGEELPNVARPAAEKPSAKEVKLKPNVTKNQGSQRSKAKQEVGEVQVGDDASDRGIRKPESQHANEILQRLRSQFRVDVVADWGAEGRQWRPGTWTLAELQMLSKIVDLLAETMGGKDKFIRNIGGISIKKADIGSYGAEALAHRISLSATAPFTAWTLVHQLAHTWNANYNWKLSESLVKYTGGSTNRLRSLSARILGNWDAGPNGPEDKPGRRGRRPGCNAAGYFYGDKPVGSNWYFNAKQDFAESVTMYVGWERDNELSKSARDRIIRYDLANGARDAMGIVDNWQDYAKYFRPENGDYTRTKRWKFVDELINGKLRL